MFKTKTLPSVFEASNAELVDVSDSLLTGLKIGHNGRSYVVGELALLEGNAPHKGINNAPSGERDPFFAVGLGYGTMEAALSLPSGIVQRTTASASGLQYATQLMSDRLQKEHYLDMVTEHQLDMAMRKGSIVIGRKKMDLTEMRQDVLSTYYEDIVSPTLKRAFDDADFGRARKMYVGGGGALFDELVDAFTDEFGDVLSLEVVPNPARLWGALEAARLTAVEAQQMLLRHSRGLSWCAPAPRTQPVRKWPARVFLRYYFRPCVLLPSQISYVSIQ